MNCLQSLSPRWIQIFFVEHFRGARACAAVGAVALVRTESLQASSSDWVWRSILTRRNIITMTKPAIASIHQIISEDVRAPLFSSLHGKHKLLVALFSILEKGGVCL